MASKTRPGAEPLFGGYDFHSLQQHKRQQMEAEIAAANPELIRTGDVEELAKQFADRYALEAPTLIEGALSISVEEAQVDVTGNFYFGAFGPGPTYVTGIRASYHVPFSGDREMFFCAPSTRNLSMRPAEVRAQELIFAYERCLSPKFRHPTESET